eukprot:5648041-Pleurochrysis_carterae.AAC.1
MSPMDVKIDAPLWACHHPGNPRLRLQGYHNIRLARLDISSIGNPSRKYAFEFVRVKSNMPRRFPFVQFANGCTILSTHLTLNLLWYV